MLVYCGKHEEAEMTARMRARAPTLCDRRGHGVGADGMMLIAGAAEESGEREACVHVSVTMINADGSLAAMCGNACRVIAASVAERTGKCRVEVQTFARVVMCTVAFGVGRPVVSVGMGRLTEGAANAWHASVLARVDELVKEHGLGEMVRRVSTSSTGNNHVVLELAAPPTESIFCALGLGLQTGTALDGINVHVVCPQPPTATQAAEIRTVTGAALAHVWTTLIWERGAGRTQACGTGACAVARHAVSGAEAAQDRHGWVAVQMPGGLLFVRVEPEDGACTLVGRATRVFRGTLLLDDEHHQQQQQ